jgi:coenzyme F420-reducing hydrogenase gamma subunit
MSSKPRIAVFKLASCDGCQLSLLDLEDELLALASTVEVAYFPEASRAVRPGPYQIGLVEGSVSTPEDARKIRRLRRQCRTLVTIGACATAGGIQALRNFHNTSEWLRVVYPSPSFIHTLSTSTPVAEHVAVDYELRGCPVNKHQLLELLAALLAGRKPNLPTHSVCVECKRRDQVCVLIAGGVPCLGPVTQAGCGAICPRFGRGCYGCFGPMETPNAASLCNQLRVLGQSPAQLERAFRTFNAWAPAFRQAGQRESGT